MGSKPQQVLRDKAELESLIQVCLEVSKLAGRAISRDQIEEDWQNAPHKKPSEDQMRFIYIFMLPNNEPLKVGMSAFAGRHTELGHQYRPGKGGTLAHAILRCKKKIMDHCPTDMHSELDQLGEGRIESWMVNKLDLIKFRFEKNVDPMAIALLEVFLQCKLNPVFEGAGKGWGSQKKLRDPPKKNTGTT